MPIWLTLSRLRISVTRMPPAARSKHHGVHLVVLVPCCIQGPVENSPIRLAVLVMAAIAFLYVLQSMTARLRILRMQWFLVFTASCWQSDRHGPDHMRIIGALAFGCLLGWLCRCPP